MTDWEDQASISKSGFSFFVDGMKNLWELLGDTKDMARNLIIWIIAVDFLSLVFPLIIKLVFDELQQNHQKITSNLVFLIFALCAIRLFWQFLNNKSLEKRFIEFVIHLENLWPIMAQRKLLDLSISYHEKENTGKKIAKINKGCEKLVDILCRMRWNLLPNSFYFVLNLGFIFFLDYRLGLIFIAPILPAIYVNTLIWKRFEPVWEKWEDLKEDSTGFFCQSILNIRTVQNFSQENREFSCFSKIRKEMEKIDIDATLSQLNYFFLMDFFMMLSFLSTIITGVVFVINGQCTMGTVVYIVATGSSTFQSLWQVMHEYSQTYRKLIAVMSMKRMLDEKQEIQNSQTAMVPNSFFGNIELKNILFNYPNKENPVLNGLNLFIESQKMTALVGKSGEGKTTIFKLLCRMYEISGGEILLDGKNIKDIDLFWYRRLFAVVQQDVDIFDASIADNIRYPNLHAKDEDVIEAIKAASLSCVLNENDRFPQGIGTQVGERGVRLSGGERQRVGIARAYLALLYGAKFLILDEATSNLDSQAERAIQEMIAGLREKQSVTIVACAHRLSTIKRADMIYVIGEGKVIEQGDHQRLQKKNGLYAKFVKLQEIGELEQGEI